MGWLNGIEIWSVRTIGEGNPSPAAFFDELVEEEMSSILSFAVQD